jgi:DNA polymerase/3'-5' exonuclease PolX
MDNHTVARQLLNAARSLEQGHASLFRVRAYRQAAHSGRKALKRLPGIGASLSAKIETLVRTGEIATLKEDEKTLVAV